ncbi:MAG: hypothetical protein FWG26_03030 [Betaproteobacteria bacterium]|nr:hypothetical protein [Betaproteobacteria bacterium]
MPINTYRLLKWPERLAWESSRTFGIFRRRFGIMGYLIVASAAIGITLVQANIQQAEKLDTLQRQIKESQDAALYKKQNGTEAPSSTSGRALLHMFEENLLPHEDIPALLQSLLQIAEEEGILIQHGDYRLEDDSPGSFMRYRMNLPVQGAAPAIDRFIQRTLAAWKALALHSVRFTRSEISSDIIESQLQWVAMVQLPKTPYRPVHSTSENAR